MCVCVRVRVHVRVLREGYCSVLCSMPIVRAGYVMGAITRAPQHIGMAEIYIYLAYIA